MNPTKKKMQSFLKAEEHSHLNSQPSISTQSQIMDAAEKIFAQKGINATTIRDIVQAANVNLASVHYHFGSKEGLISSVIRRIARPIATLQMQNLEALELKNIASAEAVIYAFFWPLMEIISPQFGIKGYIQAGCLGRCSAEPDTEYILAQEFHISYQLMTQALQATFTHSSQLEIEQKISFSMSIVTQILQSAYQAYTSDKNIFQAQDDIYQQFFKFAIAGIKS